MPERVVIGDAELWLGDCREIIGKLSGVDCVVTDPPYGIAFKSGMTGHHGGIALPGIVGDEDTSLRDRMLEWWGNRPAIVFGSWKRTKPRGCHTVLTWEKGDHVGMGDLSIPWKPNTEEIYIIGSGFCGHRGSSVIRINAPPSWNSVEFGRSHPNEKPILLMRELIDKCVGRNILDPFMGSGTTLVAALRTGRKAIGIEREPKYFEIACKRIQAEMDRSALFADIPDEPTQTDLYEAHE
jgi:DNA modification methylase